MNCFADAPKEAGLPPIQASCYCHAEVREGSRRKEILGVPEGGEEEGGGAIEGRAEEEGGRRAKVTDASY